MRTRTRCGEQKVRLGLDLYCISHVHHKSQPNLVLAVHSTSNSIMAYQVPRKAILLPEQLAHFQTSETHKKITGYIEALNNSVVGVKLTDGDTLSQTQSAVCIIPDLCTLTCIQRIN